MAPKVPAKRRRSARLPGHYGQEVSKPSEKRDDEAILSDLATASGEGLAILGLKPALSEGRVKLLLISTELQSQPGALCTSCRALSSPEAMCPICGAPTAPVDDIVEAAVERAVHSGECRFVRGEYLDAAERMLAGVCVGFLLQGRARILHSGRH